MTMNIGNGYPTTNNGIISTRNMTLNNTGNMQQYFMAKYGCENCLKQEPYWCEYPKSVINEPKNYLKPNIWERIKKNILGG